MAPHLTWGHLDRSPPPVRRCGTRFTGLCWARSIRRQTFGSPVGTERAAARAHAALTPREREVAALVARGLTNQQIAETLVVQRGTVANHVAHILGKLDLSNRTQLASYLTRAGSAEPSGDNNYYTARTS